MVVKLSAVSGVSLRIVLAGLFGLLAVNADRASGQNPNYPGYLGVYVMEGHRGMTITGFIPETPARVLAEQGSISRNDTIVRLAGLPTRTLYELRYARNCIPAGKEAKMLIREPSGGYYHVWISRSDAIAAASGPAEFRAGSEGVGSEPDVRDRGAAGSSQKPPADEEGSSVRDRR